MNQSFRCFLAVTFLFTVFGAAPAISKPDSELTQIQKDLLQEQQHQSLLIQESQKQKEEVQTLQKRLIKAAKDLRATEEELIQVETEINRVETEEREETEKLLQDRHHLSELLITLQRLSRIPPEAVLTREDNPRDLLRSALLLRSIVPELRQKAITLAQELEHLANLRENLAQQHEAAANTRRSLRTRHKQLATLLEQRKTAQQQTEEERLASAKTIAELRAKASSLHELMDEVEEAHNDDESSSSNLVQRTFASVPRLKGFRYPASGPIKRAFGTKDRNGLTSRGISIGPLPGAVVVAPLDGKVRFSGVFKGYGQIVILEHDHKYHSLIAGLGHIDTVAGQFVKAGEPLGVMPEKNSPNSTDLYYELRENGQPINPKTLLNKS